MKKNKTDAKLIKALQEAPWSTQLRAAVNLAKIGRFDIINAVKSSDLLERLSSDPEYQRVMARYRDAEKRVSREGGNWSGSDEAKKLWENNKSIRDEFENDLESYLAYCRGMDSGRVKASRVKIEEMVIY